jgi:hypothetical protein
MPSSCGLPSGSSEPHLLQSPSILPVKRFDMFRQEHLLSWHVAKWISKMQNYQVGVTCRNSRILKNDYCLKRKDSFGFNPCPGKKGKLCPDKKRWPHLLIDDLASPSSRMAVVFVPNQPAVCSTNVIIAWLQQDAASTEGCERPRAKNSKCWSLQKSSKSYLVPPMSPKLLWKIFKVHQPLPRSGSSYEVSNIEQERQHPQTCRNCIS